MTSCATCLNGFQSDRCQFPRSEWCRFEARLEDQAHAINDSYKRAEAEAKKCPGYQWIGQSLRYCDGCGRPYWEHDYLQLLNREKPFSPFSTDEDCWKYEPITEAEKIAARRKWGDA